MTDIIRTDGLHVMIAPQAKELLAEALERSGIIGRVTNVAEQEAMVAAVTGLETIIRQAEESRKAVKAPVIACGREIDRTHNEFIAAAKEERDRGNTLLANFHALEVARQMSAEALRCEELSDLEKRREDELKQAQTFEERDEIQARYNEEAASTAIAPAPSHIAGQVIKQDYEITVEDYSLLARLHYPELCSIKEKVGAIKEAIRQNRKVYGISFKPITKSSVRLIADKKEAVINV